MLAIIGGTGMTQLACLEISHRQVMRTPYGEPSGPLTFGRINNHEIVFLARMPTVSVDTLQQIAALAQRLMGWGQPASQATNLELYPYTLEEPTWI